ncbi:hypothetical protein ACFL38_03455 [Candidatus Omnitrophota bacterium]
MKKAQSFLTVVVVCVFVVASVFFYNSYISASDSSDISSQLEEVLQRLDGIKQNQDVILSRLDEVVKEVRARCTK